MQVTVESTSNLGRRMTVQVPAERIDKEVEKRLQSMRPRVNINGFRPGKVPLRVVKQRYQQQVAQEVIGEVLQSSYQEAVSEQNLQPAGGPEIQPGNMGVGEGLEYTATFDVYPDFELAPVASLEIVRPVAGITDADIDNVIERIRHQQKSWEVTEGPARRGDSVTIDYSGTVDGEAFEGGQGEDQGIELGSGDLIDTFEDQLIGVRTNDRKIVEVTFPEDYGLAAVAGKTAHFDVTVKSVSTGTLPEVNEAFIQGLGIAQGDTESLRGELRANMQRESVRRANNRIKEQALQALRDANPIELPQALIDQEITSVRRQAVENFGRIDEGKLPDELFIEEARRRVANALIMGEIAKQQQLSPDSQKVEQALNELAAGYEDPQQVINHYRANKDAMAKLESMVMEDQVVEWVLQHANVSDTPISFDELVNPTSKESEG